MGQPSLAYPLVGPAMGPQTLQVERGKQRCALILFDYDVVYDVRSVFFFQPAHVSASLSGVFSVVVCQINVNRQVVVVVVAIAQALRESPLAARATHLLVVVVDSSTRRRAIAQALRATWGISRSPGIHRISTSPGNSQSPIFALLLRVVSITRCYDGVGT